MSKGIALNNNHWRLEDYKQRMTEADWREILLADRDMLTMNGRVRYLTAKKLGYGVVEVSKVPLEE